MIGFKITLTLLFGKIIGKSLRKTVIAEDNISREVETLKHYKTT